MNRYFFKSQVGERIFQCGKTSSLWIETWEGRYNSPSWNPCHSTVTWRPILTFYIIVLPIFDSLEKTLMLGGIGGKRRRGRQRMRWLDGIADSMDSGSWWWAGRPGVLQFMGSQRVGHDWGTDLIWLPILLDLVFFFENLFFIIIILLNY